MAMRIVANRPDPAILGLPWHLPLEEWPDDVVVPLPRGLSRHVVRSQIASTGSAALVRTRTVTVSPKAGASSETWSGEPSWWGWWRRLTRTILPHLGWPPRPRAHAALAQG